MNHSSPSFLGAQARREVGRFLSKQLLGLRTLFSKYSFTYSEKSLDNDQPSQLTNKMDIYLHFRFISIF